MSKKLCLTFCVVSSLTFAPRLHAASHLPTKTVQNKVIPTVNPGFIMGAATDEPKKVEYTLPYPGIGPDHPLFTVKKLRDWLILKLIVDPLRKTEFYLLQSDKRLGMAKSLVEKGKLGPAQLMFSQEVSYMEKAVREAEFAKSSGKQVPGHILDRLERSMATHIQVLQQLIRAVTGEIQTEITKKLSAMQTLERDIEKLK